MSPTRWLAPALAVLVAASLVACSSDDGRDEEPVTATSDGTDDADSPTDTATTQATTDAVDVACVDGEMDVTTGTDLVVTQDCALVRVSGQDIEVDLTAAVVDRVEINGDRNEVDAASLTAVEISGQDNDVDATAVGSLDIHGDRKKVDVDRELGSVAVNGNDNEIEAGTLGSVADNGDRNVIREDD